MDHTPLRDLVKPYPRPVLVPGRQDYLQAVHALNADVNGSVGEDAPRVATLAVMRAEWHVVS
jgi:hypothetical protein